MLHENDTIMLTEEELGALKETFYAQALEMCEELTGEIISLEANDCASDSIKRIKRYFHTLKGDSSSIGLKGVSELIHCTEDVMAALDEKVIPFDGQVSEVLLRSVDEIEKSVNADRAGMAHEVSLSLRESMNLMLGKARKVASISPLSEYEELVLANSLSEGKKIYRLSLQFSVDCVMKSASALLLLQYLSDEVEVIRVTPSPEDPAIESASSIECFAASNKTADELRAACLVPGVTRNASCEEIDASELAVTAATELPGESGDGVDAGRERQGTVTIRVMSERLDQIMDLVGELVMGRSMIEELVGRFESKYPKDELVHGFIKTKSFISRSLSDLQRSVMSIRMIPVEKVFRRFPRMVRDLSKASGKEINVQLRGERTEIDKALVDIIGEPLLHIIRNAVDHGIESPDERRKAGKPQEASIVIEACHSDSDIVIRVTDDGRGINTARVREKAVEMGLASQEKAAAMDENEAMGLIFVPGFSTAVKISDISGRGIGMDIVKETVEAMRGSITLSSTPGKGTEFTLRFPLTLSIMRAVLVWASGCLYAIPLGSVLDIKRVRSREIDSITGMDALSGRDGVLPLAGIDGQGAGKNGLRRAKAFVLTIHHGGRKVGLVVDGLAGEEELVVKSVDERVLSTPLVSGASILGNGKVVLILNVGELVSKALKNPDALGYTRFERRSTGTNG